MVDTTHHPPVATSALLPRAAGEKVPKADEGASKSVHRRRGNGTQMKQRLDEVLDREDPHELARAVDHAYTVQALVADDLGGVGQWCIGCDRMWLRIHRLGHRGLCEQIVDFPRVERGGLAR